MRQPTVRWVNDAGGNWNVASNWIDVATNAARVPTTTDDVLIDVPTDALITFGTGVVTVNSILSNERFSQSGGTLTVTDTMQVNNTFTLGIDQFFSNNIPTFKGTLLRGTGGQGLTLVGESRLNTATIQTDITAPGSAQLRLTGGLALTGTFTGPTVASTNVQIGLEGSQTISSGNFISNEAVWNAGPIQFSAIGTANVTFSQDVTLSGQIRIFSGGYYNSSGTTNILNVVNYATMKVGGQANVATNGIVLSTSAESFVNHGLLESQGAASLVLNAKTFTNSATGRIKIEQPAFTGAYESLGAGGTTDTFVNAGTIELINAGVQIMSRPDGLPRGDGVTETWSNTGTIIVDKSMLRAYGTFTSEDLVNVRNTGWVQILGLWNNVGRTFTFNTQTGRFIGGGTIRGGTLVMSGPNARLDMSGTFDGVTLRGDMQLGGLTTDPVTGTSYLSTNATMRVINGLTLDGVISIPANTNARVAFVGAQTVSGGTFLFTPRTDGIGGFGASGLQAMNGGPVVLDSSVTIRAQANGEFFPTGGALIGNFISNASIIMNAYAGISLSGIQHETAPISFVNRGTITVPATSTLTATRPFTNEGQIIVSGGTMVVNTPSNDLVSPYLNTGTIDLTGNGVLRLENNQYQTTPYRTADLGTIIDPGARVFINEYSVIDNAGATLVIDGTTSWSLTTRSQIVGGTIQVDNTAKFVVNGGILRDVTVNGNSTDNFNDLVLVGEVDFNGDVAGKLQFGQAPLFPGAPPLFPDVPLIIRGGNFDLGRRSITGSSGTPSVTLEADVVFKGYASSATFTSPLTNRGQIIASPFSGVFFDADRLFHFTAAPITNEGTLSAINRGILRINNLAAPSSGVVSAAVDSTVEFTGAFAQTAAGTTRIDIGGTASTQFGLVVVGATATLAGKLDVRFASGYTPTVGSRYQVMNYASRTGQFDTLDVTGLAAGLASRRSTTARI